MGRPYEFEGCAILSMTLGTTASGATMNNAVSNTLWRGTVIVHRYLGVFGGLLMLMWFLSGIVMVYVPYPRTSEAERVRTLQNDRVVIGRVNAAV